MDMANHEETPSRVIPLLSNYALAVLWFTAELRKNNLLLWNADPYVIELLSKYVDVVPVNRKTSQDETHSLYLIKDDKLVYSLQKIGFCNIGDKDRTAPPVESFVFLKAFTETCCDFEWKRCYNKGAQSNMIHDSFAPCVTYKDNYDVIEEYKKALVVSECCYPSRTLLMGKRGCSTKWSQYSRSYLSDVHRIFSIPVNGETNADFWERFYNHITHEPISYQEYCQKCDDKKAKKDAGAHKTKESPTPTTVKLYAYIYEESYDDYNPARQYVYMGEYKPPEHPDDVLKGVAITATIPAESSISEGPDGVAIITPHIDMFVTGYNVKDFAVPIQIRYKPGLTLRIWNRSIEGLHIIDKQFYDIER